LKDITEAINWLENNCEVYYDDDTFFYNTPIKLKYGVDMRRDAKKYNL